MAAMIAAIPESGTPSVIGIEVEKEGSLEKGGGDV